MIVKAVLIGLIIYNIREIEEAIQHDSDCIAAK